MKLIAGLGNPGSDYENTRHNAGFLTVDLLLRRYGLALERKMYGSLFVSALVNNIEVGFIKPMNYMNLSGKPVRRVMDDFSVEPQYLLVIHDDIDIPLGNARLKVGGGHAGHNGVRSVIDEIGSAEFNRIRIGVGRPDDGGDVTDHVLDEFEADEKDLFMKSLDKALELVENHFLN